MSEPMKVGRFTVLEAIGESGTVFRVTDPRGGDPRALHVVPVPDREWSETLRRDLSALIREPIDGVVTVYEFDFQDGVAHILTEPLEARFDPEADPQSGARTDRVDALDLVGVYCGAVTALRARSISCVVISPTSLWRTTDGGIKLASVRVAPADPSRLTSTGVSNAADVRYMSPEMLAGHGAPPSAATDVFAAAVLLYELLTRRRPFSGDSSLEYAAAVIRGRRNDLPTPVDDHQRAIMALVERALDPEPGQRPGLAEFANELDRLRPRPTVAAIETERGTARHGPEAEAAPISEPVFDENVQFTVYRPRRIASGEWEPLLVFAHLTERRSDEPDEPDPIAEVERQAEAILGSDGHTHQTVDSTQAVPREGEITFIPHAAGVEFDPPARRFRWTNPVHREEFLLRTAGAREGAIIRGRVTAYLGTIILAEIPLTLTVGDASRRESPELAPQSARPYRRIFASYSHRDRAVVEEFAAYAKAVGDRYQMDVIDLRSGESWQPALESLIREADVFQLFWSWNAIDSPYVRREWEYALQLGRPSFVRPVYWDDPMPRRGDLPPMALLDLHFESVRPHVLSPRPTSGPSAAMTGAQASVPSTPAAIPPPPVPMAPVARPTAVGAPAVAKARSWRTYTAAAAVVLAVVMLPTLYLATRSSVPASDPGVSAVTTPASSLTVVVRSDDGQVRADTDVELVDPASGRVLTVARTDASGRVVFRGVKTNTYDIRTKGAASEAQERVLVTRDPVVLDLVVTPRPTSTPLPADRPVNVK